MNSKNKRDKEISLPHKVSADFKYVFQQGIFLLGILTAELSRFDSIAMIGKILLIPGLLSTLIFVWAASPFISTIEYIASTHNNSVKDEKNIAKKSVDTISTIKDRTINDTALTPNSEPTIKATSIQPKKPKR